MRKLVFSSAIVIVAVLSIFIFSSSAMGSTLHNYYQALVGQAQQETTVDKEAFTEKTSGFLMETILAGKERIGELGALFSFNRKEEIENHNSTYQRELEEAVNEWSKQDLSAYQKDKQEALRFELEEEMEEFINEKYSN